MPTTAEIGILNSPHFDISPHTHDKWEMTYYTKGSGLSKVGGQEQEFTTEDIIIKPPGIPHAEYSTCGFQNIFIWLDHLDGFDPEKTYQFRDLESGYLKSLLMQAYVELHTRRRNWENIVNSLMHTVLQYLISLSLEKRKNPYVEKFEALLVSNISNKNFCISEALKVIPLCPDHFKKLFKKEIGVPPSMYLAEKRINQAKLLLENKQAGFSVKQVAGQVGFDDPLYFSRVFRKHTGKYPSHWS